MDALKRTEEALAGLRWETPPELDESILENGFSALDKAVAGRHKQKEQPPVRELGALGALFRGSWRKFAVAGASCGAVLAIVLILLGPGVQLTLADVQAAVSKYPWVHVEFDNGREEWASLSDGRRYRKGGRREYKPLEGGVLVLDYRQGIAQSYQPILGNSILQSKLVSARSFATPWDFAVGDLEEDASAGDDVKKHREKLNGRDLVRFDAYRKDSLGKRILVQQVWADPASRLPVRIRMRLATGLRERRDLEWITGEYDFPESGPSSIYDLGVPRDAEIVRFEEGGPQGEVGRIVELSDQAADRFPERYRVVIWPKGRRFHGLSDNHEIIYVDGLKMRLAYGPAPRN